MYMYTSFDAAAATRHYWWTNEAEATLDLLLTAADIDKKVAVAKERRFPHRFWDKFAEQMRSLGYEHATRKACRSKYYERLKPGLSPSSRNLPFEAWEDAVLEKERSRGTSFIDISRYALKHRSDRSLNNRMYQLKRRRRKDAKNKKKAAPAPLPPRICYSYTFGEDNIAFTTAKVAHSVAPFCQ